MARIAIIGTGYVGLTTGACLADLGHDVTCVDLSPDKIARLRAGICPIVEHGLDHLLRSGLTAGNLRFTVDTATAVDDRDFVYLCVPTPQGPDGAADLSYVQAAARQIARHLPAGAIVINKSTVPVGTSLVVADALGRSDVAVVSNPEFLREGTAVHDFLHPDRVVVGSDDPDAGQRVAGLYLGLRAPIVLTDAATAETIKYASNAYLATKLSFVNAISAVCEAVDANVDDVLLGMGYDQRIGSGYLRPGPGWGGSCFGKDTRALLHIAETGGYDFALLRGAIRVNEEQLDRMVDKIAAAAGGLPGANVAAFGLTFKAGTDDLRDSPAVEIVHRLQVAGANVVAYDPAVHHLPDVTLAADPYAAAAGAQVLAVLTEWDEFRCLDVDKLAASMTAPRHLVDTRGILDRRRYEHRGFTVQTVATALPIPVPC